MEFTQVLDAALTVLPLIFCAAFVTELTNSVFRCWDSATPRLSQITRAELPQITRTQSEIEPAKQLEAIKIESVEQPVIADPWSALVNNINTVKPAPTTEIKQTLLLPPAQIEKRKPGRPKKNPAAVTTKKSRAKV